MWRASCVWWNPSSFSDFGVGLTFPIRARRQSVTFLDPFPHAWLHKPLGIQPWESARRFPKRGEPAGGIPPCVGLSRRTMSDKAPPTMSSTPGGRRTKVPARVRTMAHRRRRRALRRGEVPARVPTRAHRRRRKGAPARESAGTCSHNGAPAAQKGRPGKGKCRHVFPQWRTGGAERRSGEGKCWHVFPQ